MQVAGLVRVTVLPARPNDAIRKRADIVFVISHGLELFDVHVPAACFAQSESGQSDAKQPPNDPLSLVRRCSFARYDSKQRFSRKIVSAEAGRCVYPLALGVPEVVALKGLTPSTDPPIFLIDYHYSGTNGGWHVTSYDPDTIPTPPPQQQHVSGRKSGRCPPNPFSRGLTLVASDRDSIHLTARQSGRHFFWSRTATPAVATAAATGSESAAGGDSAPAATGGLLLSSLRLHGTVAVLMGDARGPDPSSAGPIDRVSSESTDGPRGGSTALRRASVMDALNGVLPKELTSLIAGYCAAATYSHYILADFIADMAPSFTVSATGLLTRLVSSVWSSAEPAKPASPQLRDLNWFVAGALPQAIPLSPSIVPLQIAAAGSDAKSGTNSSSGGGGGGGTLPGVVTAGSVGGYRMDQRFVGKCGMLNSGHFYRNALDASRSCIVCPHTNSIIARFDPCTIPDSTSRGWLSPDASLLVLECSYDKGLSFHMISIADRVSSAAATGTPPNARSITHQIGLLPLKRRSGRAGFWFSADSKYLYYQSAATIFELDIAKWRQLSPPELVSGDELAVRASPAARKMMETARAASREAGPVPAVDFTMAQRGRETVDGLDHYQRVMSVLRFAAPPPGAQFSDKAYFHARYGAGNLVRSGWRQANVLVSIRNAVRSAVKNGSSSGKTGADKKSTPADQQQRRMRKPPPKPKPSATATATAAAASTAGGQSNNSRRARAPAHPNTALRLQRADEHRKLQRSAQRPVTCSVAATAAFTLTPDVSARLIGAVQSLFPDAKANADSKAPPRTVKHVRCVAASTDFGVYFCLEPASRVWCVVSLRAGGFRVWRVTSDSEQLAQQFRNFSGWTVEPRTPRD